MSKIFKPRLNGNGWTKTKWFTKEYNNFVKNGISVPNCTVHVAARWAELFNHNAKEELWGDYDHVLGNAKYWYADKSIGVNKDLKRGSKPKLGAIVCFDGNYGHVCVVEKIEGNKVTCSYQEKDGTPFSLATENWTVGKTYPKYGWGKFQGYIYPPVEFVLADKSVDELAKEVIDGKWGNGDERYDRLTEAGYDYDKVQDRVNELMGPSIKVGDKVKVKKGAKWYDGKSIASFVFNETYDVIEVSGNRVVIGKGKAVTGAIDKKYLY